MIVHCQANDSRAKFVGNYGIHGLWFSHRSVGCIRLLKDGGASHGLRDP